MKPILKFSFIALLAVYACTSKTDDKQKADGLLDAQNEGGLRQVTSVADIALGYLIEIDSGQADSTLHANMKKMRGLDQDFRKLGTGECTNYRILASCSCMCGGKCCYCSANSGPIFMAGSSSITSVRIGTAESTQLNSTEEEVDGIKIFTLNVGSLRGNFDLIIDYQGGSIAVPVTATSEGILKVSAP